MDLILYVFAIVFAIFFAKNKSIIEYNDFMLWLQDRHPETWKAVVTPKQTKWPIFQNVHGDITHRNLKPEKYMHLQDAELHMRRKKAARAQWYPFFSAVIVMGIMFFALHFTRPELFGNVYGP